MVEGMLAADVVLFSNDRDAALRVLLIKRGWEPFEGCWALPGGGVDLHLGETFEECARRELLEETGLLAPDRVVLVGVYDAPDRDPRGRVISVAFTAFLRQPVTPEAADDAVDARWVLVGEVLAGRWQLAFDHAEIVKAALGVATADFSGLG